MKTPSQGEEDATARDAARPSDGGGDARVSMVLALSTLLGALGNSVATIALPSLARAFGAPLASAQWVVTAYLIAVAAAAVLAGRLGDLFGARRLLLIGLGLYAAAAALAAMAPTLALLVVARAAQGLGGAALLSLPLALARETIPRQRTGAAMGLLGSMSAIGTALGPALGGLLIARFGWPAPFWLLAALGVAALIATARALPSPPARAASSPRRPASDARPLADRVVIAGLLTNLLVSIGMMATLVVGPFYLINRLGLSEALAGLVVAAGPAMSALAGAPAGRAADRFGAPRMLIVGLAQMAIGFIGLAVLPATLGVAGYVASLALLTPGFQLFLAANSTVMMLGAPEDRRGVIAGLLGLSRSLGFILGAAAMATLFTLAAGPEPAVATAIVPETAASERNDAAFRATFLLAAALTGLAAAVALGLGRSRD